MNKDELILKQKHIIFSSLICLDMDKIDVCNIELQDVIDGNTKYKRECVKNSALLYSLSKSYHKLRHNNIINRIRFNIKNTGVWERHKLKLNIYYDCGYDKQIMTDLLSSDIFLMFGNWSNVHNRVYHK